MNSQFGPDLSIGDQFFRPGYGRPFLITEINGTKKTMLTLNLTCNFHHYQDLTATNVLCHCLEFPGPDSPHILRQLSEPPQDIRLLTAAPLAVLPADHISIGPEGAETWYEIVTTESPRPELVSISARLINRLTWWFNSETGTYERLS